MTISLTPCHCAGGERGRMTYKFTIQGRLDGLNEYTAANRTNPYKGGKNEKRQ